jgi:ribosomal protein S18 acetylase RimI-like enzyme
MVVEELSLFDETDVIQLWASAGLTRAWNDAPSDFRRALEGPTSTVLGMKIDGALVGTAMVGHDGHRGWIYYLAVDARRREEGIGSMLVSAAEEWLKLLGVVKVQLMVGSENEEVLNFFAKVSYEVSDVRVLSRWLNE